jgi:predicted alpha/beta-fold hydrolase
VGAPFDLTAGGKALGRGLNLVYTRMFLATLKPKVLQKIERFPGIASADAIRAARDLYAYDNAFTAPVHGFRDADDYWARASGKPWLRGVRVPLLALNARNDPFVPAASLPRLHEVSSHVYLEQPAGGGHIGFAGGGVVVGTALADRVFGFFQRGA